MIRRIIRWIISFFTRHKKGVIVGAAAIGGAGAGAGIFNAHKAKKINRQALDIQQNALEKHEQAYQETQAVLALLGEVEKDAIDSFVHFADTMERIQGRPKFKSNIFSTVKLPNYEPEEIKNLSAEVRMAIDGVVGAGVGGLAGLAAFGAGAGALVAAPAMALGGVVLCVKGFGLKKKAIENKRQAKQMEKSVDEIVASSFEATEIFLKPETELDPVNLCLCPNCAAAYRKLRTNTEIMDNVRRSIQTMKDSDIENGDYVTVSLDDDDELWFTQTHFAEIRELMKLAEEVKQSKQAAPAPASVDDECEKSGMSVYSGYIGKKIRRKDGFVGTVTNVTTNGDSAYVEVHVTGGKDAGKDTKIQLSFILKNRGVYSISE